MSDMDRTRFEAIVAAYGADPRRWPEVERAAAEAFGRSDAAAARLLDEEWAFDALLLSHMVAPPSAALAASIVALHPRARVWTRARIGWSALLLALTGAAGVAAGSAATAAALTIATPAIDARETGTAFGDLAEAEIGR
ncbi:hypothetical protein HL653_15385 [Sphingomonas sp. AP4-R1]|uniref:hypothetical protein n=1 Tax=Sphingomonas sp. AP4-R1 TaxID=2735134 RepID=UPI0014932A09|nr:hypothetical protein [Sphingomonas sp. AP4-R1]QJU58965.1 hypothetical protein HL653_15385 [Sphingomonas sp. AP4-R1]